MMFGLNVILFYARKIQQNKNLHTKIFVRFLDSSLQLLLFFVIYASDVPTGMYLHSLV